MISILTPQHSFVQFSVSDAIESCNFPDIHLCLPVYEANDVNFQFVLQGTTDEEIADLLDLANEKIAVGVVQDCDDGFLLEFTGEKPQRFSIGNRQVLYNWDAGLPNFTNVIGRGECFMIKIIVDDTYEFCSNCFQRIANPCHTSVIEYGNDDNFAGFNYCNSEGDLVEGGSEDCEATFITFTNIPTLTVPYTAQMLALYGNLPTVQTWLYDGDELVDAGIRVTFNGYPPTQLNFNFGGPASGVIKVS